MEFKVVYTKSFNSLLRGLQQQGHKKVVQAVRATISEAAMNGDIKSLPRTKHGESRIPDVEKFDLPDGFRLVVQLVDGAAKTRAFLFVGSHDDAQRWLDSHRKYRWVKSRTDGTLDFVQISDDPKRPDVPADRVDLDSSEDLLVLPLLRVLSDEEWQRLDLPPEAMALAREISGSDFERDADGLFERLHELAGWNSASVLLDLLTHAHAREWQEVHKRLAVIHRDAEIMAPEDVAPAMLSLDNSEAFVTFDDPEALDGYFDRQALADWMLFLHPEQKKLVERDFRGPARLRGISGSGKTSVLVHRARFLAKKYRQPVLLVTLTESMRKLLDQLADDLCGVERALILSITMSALAKQVVHEVHPQSSRFYTLVPQDPQERILTEVLTYIRRHGDFARTPMAHLDESGLQDFVRDEISYVRGRLRPDELLTYRDTQAFRRQGRGLALNDVSRGVMVDAIRLYVELLAAGHWLDHEGVVAAALSALDQPINRFNTPRCVLCDEVQDLSQLEMALLGRLPTPTGEPLAKAENGLFLAGDGAQTIYKRGFALRPLGIDVSNRSFTLRKNYRNTYEILKAAFGLVSEYEFADVDEEDIARPSEPDLAKRHGARPLIIRYSSQGLESQGVATTIQHLLQQGHTPGQICVIGPSVRTREDVHRALASLGIEYTDLRQDADYSSPRVKVSTIESAKGHEFGTVFITGLVEGVLPRAMATDEIPREAARLYVAMTRARDTLILSYSPWGSYSASRFLIAIQDHSDEAKSEGGIVRRLDSQSTTQGG